MAATQTPTLKGVSSKQASAEGPVSTPLDSVRAKKCAAALLLPTASEKEYLDEQATLQEGEPATVPEPPLRCVYLTWTCLDKFGEEQYIRTRNVRLFHSAYKGMKSVLIAGGPVHRYQKKNNKKNVIDDIVSVRTLKHADIDVQKKRLKKFTDEYGLILCDNRCIRELPTALKSKVAVKLDCTDMKKFTQKVDWGLKSASIKTGKGVLSMRIGSVLLTPTELLENIRFALRFLEDHIPEIWGNLKAASLLSPGHPPLKILDKLNEIPTGMPTPTPVAVSNTEPQQKSKGTKRKAVSQNIEDVGIDIFSMKRPKKGGKAKKKASK